MQYHAKTQQLVDLIEPAIRACGVTLWGVEFLPQGKRSLLRIYIDRPDAEVSTPSVDAESDEAAETGSGVGVQDCVNVTHQVNALLDVHDPINGEYTLEVSSPGWDRPFFSVAQMQAYVGQTMQLRLLSSINNRRKWTGSLQGFEGDELILLAEDKEVRLPVSQIDRANLVYTP